MKFIIYKTSTYFNAVGSKKPCENCKLETVIYHYDGGRSQVEEKQYTIDVANIENLVALTKNLGDIIIRNDAYYDYPVLEIYDDYRE